MKRFVVILTIILLFFSTLIGCQEQNKDNNGNKNKNSIEYEVIKDMDTLPPNIPLFIESMKKEKGFTNIEFINKDLNVLVVTSGEKPTGGYGINVGSIAEEEGQVLKIIVNERVPEEGSVVTEALTYPYVVIKIPEKYDSFKVENKEGEEFKYIAINRVNISEEGVYLGQLDNNSIEIEINGDARTFILTEETKDDIDNLKENSEVKFTYYLNEKNQLVLNEINKKEIVKKDETKVQGQYVGQIDNFSIEVMVNGEPKAFINYDMGRLIKDISEGDKVSITYLQNENSQLELIDIKKID